MIAPGRKNLGARDDATGLRAQGSDPGPSTPPLRVRTATCSRHGRCEVTILPSGQRVPSCGCGMPKGWRSPGPGSAPPSTPPGRSHFSAKRTTCALGHPHPSRVEARVCATVYSGACGGGFIYRNVRLPLWALPPTDGGLPHYCSVDFMVVNLGKIVALIDAKSPKAGRHRSRDWERGRAAVEATYSVRVEERSA